MTDTRFLSERMGYTETTCDKCEDAILPSEQRALIEVQWGHPGEDFELLLCKSCVIEATRPCEPA